MKDMRQVKHYVKIDKSLRAQLKPHEYALLEYIIEIYNLSLRQSSSGNINLKLPVEYLASYLYISVNTVTQILYHFCKSLHLLSVISKDTGMCTIYRFNNDKYKVFFNECKTHKMELKTKYDKKKLVTISEVYDYVVGKNIKENRDS